jgi:hypothetical protein
VQLGGGSASAGAARASSTAPATRRYHGTAASAASAGSANAARTAGPDGGKVDVDLRVPVVVVGAEGVTVAARIGIEVLDRWCGSAADVAGAGAQGAATAVVAVGGGRWGSHDSQRRGYAEYRDQNSDSPVHDLPPTFGADSDDQFRLVRGSYSAAYKIDGSHGNFSGSAVHGSVGDAQPDLTIHAR